MNKIVRFHQTGGPEVLALEEVPVPSPGKGEVLIQTHALGLNRAESMFRSGEHGAKPVFPSGIGLEAAGVVESIGDGVTGFNVGDKVSVIPCVPATEYPLHGQHVLAPAYAVVAHSDKLSFKEAAAVWMMFTTAYGGLIEFGSLSQGQTVLIPAASSSVGLAAIQIANMVGARPIALTRTSTKRKALLAAGAAEVIATNEENLVERVGKITNGSGAEVIFDPVGGPVLADLITVAARHAKILLYGRLHPDPAPLDVGQVLFKQLTIRGYDMVEITSDNNRRMEAVDFIRKGLESGDLKPIIDRTFPLEDISDAHRYLEAGNHIGKIVLTVS
ncbi:zinc-dependent alcohol dehydrogenase family protein [Paenibacillus amylolyticus]|uniref:Alcohol dehydrogenase n=1 Tax=Paenibacillus amylolyticus TaxID=1451 RepID=A0A117I223_PAEAM|nr:zinc-dependent alcohol dehydrogenase family protein [Paenibacillus amylolyticus]GAS83162.1 alcohol dehydrogenase [Paenibacillus amylolyticus]